ncbi:MAG: D-3-phosphoglycerate dehydrogenase [Myxococcota bacterium]|jgi:D-3-phosphoglycerate dehydrogenase
MRILIADRLASHIPAQLEASGSAVTADPSLSDTVLTEALALHDPQVLVVRSTKVQREHILAAPSLSLVIRAGAGTNTIDVTFAASRGVYVANCPGKNAVAVAELVMGQLVNLDRRIADNVADLRAGVWAKKKYGVARGLKGRTLAVLGCGQIGAEVIARAKAFGMHVRAWSRSLTPARAAVLGVEYAATPLDACRGAHALTVHLAYSSDTHHIVNASLLEALAPGAYVINTARGGIVDEAALRHVIETRGIRAALDVFEDEPAASDSAFKDATISSNASIYGTHHIGASTDQASEAVGDEIVRIVDHYQRTGDVLNCVNLAAQSAATHLLVVRHADRVGVLAAILDMLRTAELNVQEMENIIFHGGEAACARIQLHGAPSAETLQAIRSHDRVFAASVVTLNR